SGGEQQRVAIAVAMANDPPIILADEPTGELDTETGMEIIKLFKKLNEEGKTVIIATHDMRLKEYATRILEIRDGKITG
ncbi:ATP-binding cassette domain-containing protein, partial [Pseudanabaena biceps]